MECLTIITLFQCFIHAILRTIYGLLYRSKPAPVVKSSNPLLELSATTLAKKIREGQILSENVVKAYIERIQEVNPYVNAVIEERFDAALLNAKECDIKIKNGEVNAMMLEREMPLYGLPFTVKESCGIQGLSQTGCCIARRGIKAPEDGEAVQALKNAGAIPLCVTNTSELCTAFDSTNRLFGSTSNPYDKRLTAGGSSGGEAALIGSGGSLIGIGSDLGGSVRIPSHFNGIFGHKPTAGIIPIKGHYPMSDSPHFVKYLTLGPMARYAEDLHLATKVLSSKFGNDLRLDEPVDLQKLRLFSVDNMSCFMELRKPSQEIREVIKVGTNYLVECGAKLHEVPKFWLNNLFDILVGTFFASADYPPILLNKNDPHKENNAIIELLKKTIGKSDHELASILAKIVIINHGFVSASRSEECKTMTEDLRHKFINLLKDDGVLIFPTYPVPAPFKKQVVWRTDFSIYCVFLNVLQFPSTHVPMGFTKQGLPIGFQVVAGPYQDRLCLAVAKELEKKFGGWKAPGSI